MAPKTSNNLKLQTTNGHKPSMELGFCVVRQAVSQGWKPHPMLPTLTWICTGLTCLHWRMPLFASPPKEQHQGIALDAFGGQGIW